MPAHRSSRELIAHIDGASRGNPGPAAYAVVMKTADGSLVEEITGLLGRVTNNVAEYRALLAALDYARRRGQRRLRVMSDSELLVLQIRGVYKVKSADLRPLHEYARETIARLEAFSIEHIPREQNREADRLVNQALDKVKSCIEPDHPAASPSVSEPLRASATYQQGILKPHRRLPLAEGEQVEMEIHRKK